MSVRHPGRSRRPQILSVLLLALTGCGPLKQMSLSDLDSGSPRYRSASPPSFTPSETTRPKGVVSGPASAVARRVDPRLARGDAFTGLLRRAGLAEPPPEEAPLSPEDAPLAPEDAAALFDALLAQPVTAAGFGPRLAVSRLLREVVEGDVEVARADLLERVRRFEPLAVLRPDGVLAWALTGTACQRVGEVQWREGALRAGPFEVGALYSGATGVWRQVDASLTLSIHSPVLAEVRDGAEKVHGTEDAFIELVLVLGQLLTRPGDSVAALSQLPEGLVALVESSPEYLEHFKGLTRGEQVQALSRLTAALLSTWGTAAGSTRTLAALGHGWEAASVPVLSLSAKGALVVERATVNVGRAVTVLGTGPGAAVILHMTASQRAASGPHTAPTGGPGAWGGAGQTLSPRAAHYQAQVSGRPASEAYWLEEVRFDGFEDGVLLEAKGPGFASRFNADLTPKKWFKDTGARVLVQQAERQAEVARQRGVPVRWHVAEERAVQAFRRLFQEASVEGVEVVHTPPMP